MAALLEVLRIHWQYFLQKDKTYPKRGVLGIMLNCIWWWGYNSRDLENVEYPSIAITFLSRIIITITIIYHHHHHQVLVIAQNSQTLSFIPPYQSLLLADLLGSILSLNRTNTSKSLLVGQQLPINVLKYIKESCLWVHFCFSSIAIHIQIFIIYWHASIYNT